MNGPLDVIRTRLALEEFGNRPSHVPRTLASEYPINYINAIGHPFILFSFIKIRYRRIVSEEGFTALYSGWQVVIVQFILDYWFQVWDGHASFQQQTGSISSPTSSFKPLNIAQDPFHNYFQC